MSANRASASIARPAVEHGGIRPGELRALGIDPDAVVDFSANINPLGPSPHVREALLSLDVSRYPDPDALELREALAEEAGDGVGPDDIVLGNGATEIIHLLARAVLGPGDVGAVVSPTFGEYARAIELAGASAIPVPRASATRWAMPDVLAALRESRADLTFLCNPNNPTGQYLAESDARAAVEAIEDGILALDEAYVPFVDGAWSSTPLLGSGRVVLIRSLTKDLALAGLRLGYCIAPPRLADAVRRQQQSWSVNSAALIAGYAALKDADHRARSLDAIRAGRAALIEGLTRLGLPFEPPAANFALVEAGDGADVRSRLLRRGFLVRDCASFGLPSHIRIAVRTVGECDALVEALARVLRR